MIVIEVKRFLTSAGSLLYCGRKQSEDMAATKSPISLDPMIVSDGAPGRITWAFVQTGCTTRLGRMGSCGAFVLPWCKAIERGAKGFRLTAPRESVQPGCTAEIPLMIGALIFCGPGAPSTDDGGLRAHRSCALPRVSLKIQVQHRARLQGVRALRLRTDL